ncbi:MAG: CAAX prenyl protease-related protein [Planctomycetota bacterium]
MDPRFVAPLAVYIVGTSMAARFEESGYAVAYAIAALATAGTIVWSMWRPDYREIVLRPSPPWTVGLPLALLAGIIGIVAWIVLSKLHLESKLTTWLPESLRPGERVGLSPFDELGSGAAVYAFLGVRLIGLVLLVPIAEEVFYRGFLVRWLIDDDWTQVRVGRVDARSTAVSTLLFTLSHPEWFAAITYFLLLTALTWYRRDLISAIVAHATSNAVLAGYVLATDSWWLW